MLKIENTEHGIERARQRGGFITRKTAMLQIQRAWFLGRSVDPDLFDDEWMDHEYRYFDGLVYVFEVDDTCDPPLHKTVLFPKGQTEWRVRVA